MVVTRPSGLLLDAMGTLIGLRQSVGESYAAIAQDFGLEVAPEAINGVFAGLFRQAPELAFPALSGEELAQAEERWWTDLVAKVFQACGHDAPLPDGFGTTLFQHFAGAEPWLVYPDVAANLQRWKQRGLKLAVVSNFDQRLLALLDALELSPLLDAVVVSSVVGAAKPSPLPLQVALEQLGLNADQVWHIGDSPEDQASAAAAGLRCLLIKRPKPKGTP